MSVISFFKAFLFIFMLFSSISIYSNEVLRLQDRGLLMTKYYLNEK